MNKFIAITTILLAIIGFSCKKEKASKPGHMDATTDFREAYKGKFRVICRTYDIGHPSGGGGYSYDSTYNSTLTIDYDISDSFKGNYIGTYINSPALRVVYDDGNEQIWGVDSESYMYIYASGPDSTLIAPIHYLGSGNSAINYNSGGFIGPDSINFTFGIRGTSFSSGLEIKGKKLE